MARDLRAQNVVALHRFGLAPKSGSSDSISDARSALLAELDPPGAGQIKNDDLLSSSEAARAAFDFRQERKAARLAVRAQDEAEKKQASEAAPPDKPATQQNTEAKPNPGPGVPQQIYLEESKARLDGALAAGAGFVERLVWFWSNHFCVSADKGGVRPLCGAYEREAIRPYVTGKFADMLVAVESHPAMLLYLDMRARLDRIHLPACVATKASMKTLRERFWNSTRWVYERSIRRTTLQILPS